MLKLWLVLGLGNCNYFDQDEAAMSEGEGARVLGLGLGLGSLMLTLTLTLSLTSRLCSSEEPLSSKLKADQVSPVARLAHS